MPTQPAAADLYQLHHDHEVIRYTHERYLSLAAFVRKHNISAESQWVACNPNMDDMPAGSRHWLVLLRFGIPEDANYRTVSIPFSQGPAIEQEPTVEDVLDCLASEASGIDYGTFEDWAEELGYDTDSRRAERTYKAVQAQSGELLGFLGADAYETLLYTLLYDTERL